MSTAQDQTSQNRPGEGGQEQNPGQGGNEQDVMDVPADVQVGQEFTLPENGGTAEYLGNNQFEINGNPDIPDGTIFETTYPNDPDGILIVDTGNPLDGYWFVPVQ